jgi:SsrA-binding protein
MARERGIKPVASNRKAYHDYFIEETFEAGIVLVGTEVKSLRSGRITLRDSYAEIRDGELYLVGVHISPYEQGTVWNHDPLRVRKLLVHHREIDRLAGRVNERGYSVVPTKVYFKDGRAKVELGLARGKRLYDKRADIAKRDAQRDVERSLKERSQE